MTAQLLIFPDINPSMVDPPKKIKAKPKQNHYTEEFETKVWGPYPRKINCSKFEAFKSYQRLPEDLQAQCIAAIPIFARQCVGKEEQYIPHLATWINQRRFETIPRPPECAMAGGPSPKPIDWSSVMRLYRITSNWRQELGPAPGNPGCRVPRHLLGEME
jgi:hypothetical protein